MAPLRLAAGAASRTLRPASRSYHATPALCLPYKDTQDRESLRPRSSQHTNSARDDDVAANPDAAFNPHKTSPEAAHETAAAGPDPSDPLEISGANQPVNKPRGDEKTSDGNGSGTETSKGGPSRGASAPKNKPLEREKGKM